MSKSFISREHSHGTKVTAVPATPDMLREKRLTLLSRLLTEEKQLVRESDVYSGSTEHIRHPNISPKRHRSNDTMASDGSLKKRKSNSLSERESSKRKGSDNVSIRAPNCSKTLISLSDPMGRPPWALS